MRPNSPTVKERSCELGLQSSIGASAALRAGRKRKERGRLEKISTGLASVDAHVEREPEEEQRQEILQEAVQTVSETAEPVRVKRRETAFEKVRRELLETVTELERVAELRKENEGLEFRCPSSLLETLLSHHKLLLTLAELELAQVRLELIFKTVVALHEKNLLGDELSSMRKEKRRLKIDHQTTSKMLVKTREEKGTVEEAHRSCQSLTSDTHQAVTDKQEEIDTMKEGNKVFVEKMKEGNRVFVEKMKEGNRILVEKLRSAQERKNRLEAELQISQNSLEDEKEKSLCQICLEAPKDTVCLPCVHLAYCFRCSEKHRERSRTCPTCRTALSGVLRCDLVCS